MGMALAWRVVRGGARRGALLARSLRGGVIDEG